MRINYCDRCGIEHREGEKSGRVVTVTLAPMARKMDLCGSCRADLQPLLDGFLTGNVTTHMIARVPA